MLTHAQQPQSGTGDKANWNGGTGADVTELMLKLYYFNWFILTGATQAHLVHRAFPENDAALTSPGNFCDAVYGRLGNRLGSVAAVWWLWAGTGSGDLRRAGRKQLCLGPGTGTEREAGSSQVEGPTQRQPVLT